jgi:hypothetical protein
LTIGLRSGAAVWLGVLVLAPWAALAQPAPADSAAADSAQVVHTTSENWVVSNLRRLFFLRTQRDASDDVVDRADMRYVPWRGRYIREIHIAKIGVFGEMMDGAPGPSADANWLNRAGEGLHLNTRDRVIRQQLLFDPGEPLDPFDLSDSERILRELPYIEDARIFVETIEATADSVDIVVTTRDRWSIGVYMSFDDTDDYEVGVFERNLAGSGIRVQGTYLANHAQEPPNGWRAQAAVDNIRGTFIRNETLYETSFEHDEFRTIFDRGFRSLSQRVVGGLDLQRNEIKEIPTSMRIPHAFDEIDTYGGYAFRVAPAGSEAAQRTRAISSARYTYTHFRRRPDVDVDQNIPFHDRSRLLLGASLNRLNYYKTKFVYGFGRTEDIPTGYLLSLSTGFEAGEFRDRPYGAGTAEVGGYVGSVGYLAGTLGVGAFLNAGDFEDGVFRVTLKNFSPMLHLGSLPLRQFIDVDYILGINRVIPDRLILGDHFGVRGVEPTLYGDQRFVTNLELVTYLPWSMLGFTFQPFAFGDLGLIAPESGNIFDERLYSSFGLGVRLKNEHLVFAGVEFRLGYIPENADGTDFWNKDIDSRPEIQLTLLTWQPPQVMEYR